MGQTPTFNDRFSRPGSPAKTGLRGGQDRFAGQGAPAGWIDHFGKSHGAARADAFANAQAARPAPVDRFGGKPAATRAGGFAPPPVAAVAAEPAAARRPELRVVAKQPVPEVIAVLADPLEVKYQDLKREEAWRRRAGKSSSLVLVSGAPAVAVSDVAEAPPPPARAEVAAAPPPPPAIEEPKPRSGGGGGGGPGGGAPPRDQAFNQDDFVGVMLGVAVLFLLLLWLLRGGGPQPENQIVGVQSAMNDPISVPAAAPAPPSLPPPDPFGDAAVDLTPKGPIPETVQQTPVVTEAAPAPAVAPVPVADRAMHAWFCTAGSKLTVASRKALEQELTQFTDAFAGRELIVRGYADTRGSTDFNSALGGARAKVVADFLRTKGLTVVDDKGVGELAGLDDNQNCSNQRRVDVFVNGGPGETPSRACAPEPAVEDLMCS